MILRELNIHTFGIFQEQEFQFQPGLNIVLGRNEAGKSTIYSVIEHLLFTPVKLNKRNMERELKSWFPVSGGDTIAAELTLDAENSSGPILISKQWGDKPEGFLRKAGGGTYTNDDAISMEIGSFWDVGGGTIRQVCLLRQGRLSQTVPAFRDSNEMIRSLSDILQKAFIESDGLSITGFMDTVRKQHEAYFMNWDIAKGAPNKNKGIENKWIKNVGSVLSAWYEMKELEAELVRVEQLDTELAARQKEQKQVSDEIAELSIFLKKNESAFKSAGDKRILETELIRTEEQEAQVRKDRLDWERTLKEIDMTNRSIEDTKLKITGFKELIKKSDEFEAKRGKIKRYEILKGLKERFDISKKTLSEKPAIPDNDFTVIKESYTRTREAEVQLKTGTLHASVKAKKSLHFTITTGIGKEEERDLLAGNSFETDGEGRIKLEHDDWKINVFAGGNYEAVEEEYRTNSEQYKALCRQYGVSSVTDAEKIRNSYMEAKRMVDSAEQVFSKELKDDNFDKLAEEINSFGEIPEMESTQNIRVEHARAEEQLKASEKAARQAAGQFEALQDKYKTEDEILDMHADIRGNQKDIKDQLERLPDMPEEYTSIKEFSNAYEEADQRRQNLKTGEGQLDTKIALAENALPDISLEELEENTNTARLRFKKISAEGETMGRILDTILEIRQEIEKNPYTDFYEKTERYIRKMTSSRYRYTGNTGGPILGEVKNEGGDVLGYEQLSAGTKDVLSLSLRLAMADYYLKDLKGFLLFDDPLVEMDPERQKAAAAVLIEAAERYQCILFTCHPSVCSLFPDANVVELKDGDN